MKHPKTHDLNKLEYAGESLEVSEVEIYLGDAGTGRSPRRHGNRGVV